MSHPVLMVATTPTETSDKLIDVAARLARSLDADIEVLVVRNAYSAVEPTTALAKDAAAADKVRSEVVAALAKQLETLRDAAHEVRVEVTFGEPAEGIVGRAEIVNPDFLVMGTRARSGVRRALLGSVAEGVLRVSPCPVVVVPPRAEDPDGRA
jgi:nucleotide-binding universal stress UspA family protein